MHRDGSFTQRIVEIFLRGNLSVLLIVFSLAVGAVALLTTPREEEPQIVVPMADVRIRAPGLSAEEVERQIATRLEKLLYQIDGVEDVYSMSRAGLAIVTVRFFVGEDREASLVKIYNKVLSNIDQVPADVADWVVKPVEIDDVPIVSVTLASRDPERVDDAGLRRLAEEVEIRLQGIRDASRTTVICGRPRIVRVEIDPEALAARRTSALEVAWALGVSNLTVRAGRFDQNDRNILVDAGTFLGGRDALPNVVVAVIDGAPVSLKDVAHIYDGGDEASSYCWYAEGSAAAAEPGGGENGGMPGFLPAVHVAVAKKKGTNAVTVAREVERSMEELAPSLLPSAVTWRITRNWGETADAKVDDLVEGLLVAILIVIGLIAVTLGGREAIVVVVAVPITFALTLFVNQLAGYTINRVTLFALTLALGLVVDDPIVDVENIFRHLRMRRESPFRAVLTAVNEVRPPIILATLAVIVSFVPLFFITGMMGPYMRPMAFNVPVAMLMSLVVAFTITPWLSFHMLRGAHGMRDGGAASGAGLTERIYTAVLRPFLRSRVLAVLLLVLMAALMGFAVWLAVDRRVPLKMLPFDNRNELQLVIDLPEGASLERTDAAARALARHLRGVAEVRDVNVYSGLASPMDFNGMVRHYYLREGPEIAEVRVNLIDRKLRAAQSHEIALRLRSDLEEIAAEFDANLKIVEAPPGPPVMSTITAEVYGDEGVPWARFCEAAETVAARLRREPLVCDVDTSVEARRSRWIFETDREKAALSGVSTEDIARTMELALSGREVGRVHVPDEVNPLRLVLRLPREARSSIEALAALPVKGRPGIAQVHEKSGLSAAPIPIVRIGELGRFRETAEDPAIWHKNLRRVAWVFAEVAGRAPAEAILDVEADRAKVGSAPAAGEPRPPGDRSFLRMGGGDPWRLPPGTSVVWNGEGEWKITVDVFRDLGIAFAAACAGIYLLLVLQTRSYAMPLILMISIPLTIIGIMPGFWWLNQVGERSVGPWPNPVFFTATAMIGMIALAGIAVRNAILLIEFVHDALRGGATLQAALEASGAVRFRPIFLTAGTSMLAAVPITLDPIFSGLAWALIFGLVVSTAFTLLVIPVTYDLVYRRRPGHGLPELPEGAEPPVAGAVAAPRGPAVPGGSAEGPEGVAP